jgi:hopene-associated glycosyltransferase HpnB
VLLVWLGLWWDPLKRWDFQPVGEDAPGQDPPDWPSVVVLVPARNEAAVLPQTLPSLFEQDYPGRLGVVVVDDASTDETAQSAQGLAEEAGFEALEVVVNEQKPEGWMGKVWAMHTGLQKVAAKGMPDYVLLTDADVWHSPRSLRRLVGQSVALDLGLNSRMARLHCRYPWENLLIPAFVYFFNLLYPMRAINRPESKVAGCAGGCVLLSRKAIEALGGGLETIRDCVIDDVNLARAVKGSGCSVWLGLSRSDVVSMREYPELSEIWRMVRRSAFAELKYSGPRLAGAVAGLVAFYALPWATIIAGLLLAVLGCGMLDAGMLAAWFAAIGTIIVQEQTYRPATRFFGNKPFFSWSLPVAGVLYGLMTLDSARIHWTRRENTWRGTRS